MEFNQNSNNLDLYSDFRFWCGIDQTDTTTFVIKEFTRLANFALDKIVSLIFRSDNKWQWDDNNNADLIIATDDLVAEQEDYSITVTHLKIAKVRIKDSSGNWITLKPKDRRELTDAQLTAPAGTPTSYDKLGNSYFLNPKSSYNSSEGFEVQFQRGASYFAYDDTTKEPGFASQFHRLVSLYTAKDYCTINSLNNRLAMINNEIQKMELELIEFYSSRDADSKFSISIRQDDYGQSAL